MPEMSQKPSDTTPIDPELEKAIQKGIRMFFRHYQKKMKLASSETAAHTVRAGGEMPSHERELELRGISSVVIEKMWNRLSELRKTFGQQLVLPQGEIDKALKDGVYQNPIPVSAAPLSRDRLKTLFDASFFMARWPVNEWRRLCEQETASSGLAGEQISDSLKLYRRYDKVLWQTIPTLKYEGMRSSPASHVSAGMGTALRVTWGIFNALPSAYERFMTMQPERVENVQMSVEEFNGLQDAVREFVDRLSTVHISLIVAFQKALIGSSDTSGGIPFVNHLCFRRVGKKIRLDIESEGLRKIVAEMSKYKTSLEGVARYQCPARFAHEPEKKRNLTTEVYDWVHESVQKYYLPYMGAYAVLSRDMEKLQRS